MPENTTTTTAPVTTTQGQPPVTTTTAPTTTIPDKFKDAKVEDVVKAYTELEKKYGEQGTKLGTLGEYEKYGKPTEVGEAIKWAQDVYGKMQRGELTPKQAERAIQQQQQQVQPANQPWAAEGWDFLPASEQAAKMSEYQTRTVSAQVMEQVQKIAAAYGDQINQMRAAQSREQSLLFKAIQAAQKSGGKVDMQKAMEAAAEMAALPPEELIERAFANLANPVDNEAEIEKRVAERVATEKQKIHNDNLDDFSRMASPTPRFATTIFKTRQDENRSILDKLSKDGIRLG